MFNKGQRPVESGHHIGGNSGCWELASLCGGGIKIWDGRLNHLEVNVVYKF